MYAATGETGPELTIENIEFGLRYQAPWIYADLAVYRKIFSGLLYQPTDAQGAPLPVPPDVYGADSQGLNATLLIMPIERLRLQLIGNYFDGRYSHYNGCITFTSPVTGPGCAVIDGKPLQRQPKVHLAVTPSYTLPVSWGELTTFVTYTYVGPRTSDFSGLQPIGTYNTLDFGVIAALGANWEIRVQGTNLTNELGLTEGGEPFLSGTPAPGSVILARPLEGREVNIELKYKF
jgi:outer membrane receptor protein involved in Fe transport